MNSLLGWIVLLAGGVAVFSMMARLGAAQPGPSKTLVRLHRIAGLTFAVLYLVLLYLMMRRVDEHWGEMSPRVNLHVSLAIAMFFLLSVKVSIPRLFPGLRKHLFALGLSLYLGAFTLILMTGGYDTIRVFQKSPYHYPAAARIIAAAPQEPAASPVETYCLPCHQAESFRSIRKDENGWRAAISKMNSKYPQAVPAEKIEEIVAYLVRTQGLQ